MVSGQPNKIITNFWVTGTKPYTRCPIPDFDSVVKVSSMNLSRRGSMRGGRIKNRLIELRRRREEEEERLGLRRGGNPKGRK